MTSERPPLGQKVRELRRARGLIQQDLATAAGLSMSVVAAIEQGRKRDPRLSTLRALAGALGVAPGVLVEGLPAVAKEAKPVRR